MGRSARSKADFSLIKDFGPGGLVQVHTRSVSNSGPETRSDQDIININNILII